MKATNIKPLTKGQIEAAEQELVRVIREKAQELYEESKKKMIAPYEKKAIALSIKAQALRKEYAALEKEVSKGKKMQFDGQSNYNSPASRLPDEEEDIKEYTENLFSMRTEVGNCDLKKEKQEIAEFILGLKLGTVALSELSILTAKIKAAK